MFAAIRRLLMILFTVVFGLTFALFAVRWLGSGQKFAEIDHPLLKAPFIWAGPFGKPAVAPELGAEIWHLRLNEQREWQIVIDGKMQPLPKNQGQACVWLEVIDPTSGEQVTKLSEYIKAEGLSEKVIFSTAFQHVAREMRKVEAMWLYGSSVAESAKVRMLTSLFLETVVSIDADILVVNKIKTPRLAEELHKRHKKLFLSVPSQNEAAMAVAQALKDTQKIDGAVIAP